MADIGRNLLRLTVALLKHQVTNLVGEETLSVAAETLVDIGGEKAQASLDSMLRTKEGAAELIAAAQKADELFRSRCQDDDLRQALSVPLGDLNSVQKVLAELPGAVDETDLQRTLEADLRRDFPLLTDQQIRSGVTVYLDCLHQAVLPLERFTLPIIGNAVLRNEQKLREIGADVQQVKSLMEQWRQGANAVQRSWTRPTAPHPAKPLIGRAREIEKIKELLRPGLRALTTVTLEGIPGVGKTLLAQTLAYELDNQFPGGILFERLGSDFRDPQLCNPILKRWALISGRADETAPPDPNEVRALLAGHGALLVVLDDIWKREAIEPLQSALPPEAVLLATTRSRRVAQELGGAFFPLEVLTHEDASALLHDRLSIADDSQDSLLEGLARELGYHAQAIDIAAGSLARLPHSRWVKAIAEMERQVKEGSGFGELHLPGDEESEGRLEAALYFSYKDLSAPAQSRFRSLGAFAADGGFKADAACAVWKCSVEEAEDQLIVFVERSLLDQREDGETGTRWQQHSLLRAYALALLQRAGEQGETQRSHAEIYEALIQTANREQNYYQVLPEYSQIRQAFAWAVQNDLVLAHALVLDTGKLQESFYLAREALDWASMLVERYRSSGSEILAAGLLQLGNSYLSLVRYQDPEQNSQQAIQAYTEALGIYNPEVSPLGYAMAQNNLGEAYRELASEREPAENLPRAIQAFTEALRFHTPDQAPIEYAMTQNNLGAAYSDLADYRDPVENLQRAMQAYRETLRFWTPETAPLFYGVTQNNLGNAYRDLAAYQDPVENLARAIQTYGEALRFDTPERAPLDFARAQNNLGRAYALLANHAEPTENLQRAIQAYNEALRFWTLERTPAAYAYEQNNMGLAYSNLAGYQEPVENLHRALQAYGEALRFYTPGRLPLDHAMTQFNLGIANRKLGETQRTIEAFESALAIYRNVQDMSSQATILAGLGNAYADLPDKMKAIECARELERLAAKPGNMLDPWSDIGDIYTTCEEPELAAQAYTEAIRADAGNAFLYRCRASQLIYLGNWAAAEADLRKAANLEPERPDSKGWWGNLAFWQKNFETAAKNYEEASKDSQDAGWNFRLALSLVGMGEPQRAKQAFDAALKGADSSTRKVLLDDLRRARKILPESELLDGAESELKEGL